MLSRGDLHVSHIMFKNLLCCRSNKVNEKNESTPIVNYMDTVFVFVSSSLFSRALLGRIIEALEKKGLQSTSIKMMKIDSDLYQKSMIGRRGKLSHDGPCVFMLWKGNDAFKKTTDALTTLGREYSVAKYDLIWTESVADTRKESELWFEQAHLLPPLNMPKEPILENGAADVEQAQVIQPAALTVPHVDGDEARPEVRDINDDNADTVTEEVVDDTPSDPKQIQRVET